MISLTVFIFLLDGLKAQEEVAPVEINGDQLEYDLKDNKIIAEGNVSITKEGVTLLCDRVEYYRETQVAVASGHVNLISNQGEFLGERLRFNLETMTGNFEQATFVHAPFYGQGEQVIKVADNQINLEKGYLTTCDHDKPHFRLFSKKIEVYPGEKAVGRNMRFLVGRLPIFFIPRYTQRLDQKEPMFTFTPGLSKNWGFFILTNWRYRLHKNFQGIVHLDYRERKDVASGIDVDYKIPERGEGRIRTYYMNERNIGSQRIWAPRERPTIERERFKAEWRHHWQVSSRTDTLLQYYRLSDNEILKDYFEREFERDPEPETFFQLTHALAQGVLSFRVDARVNRFVAALEKLPEIKLDFANQKLGNTGAYLKTTTTYSNLTRKQPSPSEDRKETMRLDTDNEVSYPLKLGFVEFKPFIGGRETYYSKTKERSKYNSIRGVFRTGATLSTKFYRIFEAFTEQWDFDIHRLRHIITPSVSYLYQHDPTIPDAQIDSFDGLDSLTRQHKIIFSLENKLQTKREQKSVDLLRGILSADFLLKEDTKQAGFSNLQFELDLTPKKGVTFAFDSNFDLQDDRLQSANFDLYLKEAHWGFNLSKRLDVDADDQITAEWRYRINPKWALRFYERFDLKGGNQKEQEFTVTRDLHAWEMELNFNETSGQGSEIWVIFRLKAFPEFMLDLGTSFNKRKAGSQSSDSKGN